MRIDMKNILHNSLSLVLTKDQRSAHGSSDITAVLMASPEAEDKTTIFDGFLVTEPVTHHGSSYSAVRCQH